MRRGGNQEKRQTKTKVVHKNLSQGCNKIRKFENKKIFNIRALKSHTLFEEEFCIIDMNIEYAA